MTRRTSICVAGSAIVAAFSAAGGLAAAERSKISPAIVPNFNLPDTSVANDGYRLTPDDLKYDCKKLTGHIQLRIRQLRSTRADTKTSELGRTMQKAATPIMGGTQRGIDQDGDNARDLSKIRAYNGRLAAKNCQTFDLERLLAPGNTDEPRPIAKAKPAAAPVVLKAAKPPAMPPKPPAVPAAPAAAGSVPAPAKAP